MSHHHFSLIERGKIEELNKLGYSSRAISKRIGRHPSSVARELKRLPGRYTAQAANHDYQMKRVRSKPHGKWSKELAALIADKLKSTWSPEQIAHTVALGNVNFKTIYNWLYAGRLTGITVQNLRRKGRKRSCRNLAFYARGTPIRKRPKEVYDRKTFGHWELDTVVSPRHTNGCFATFVERKTRFYTAIPMPNLTASSMEAAIKHLFGIYPNGTFKTATTDRGGEFACYDVIQRDLSLTLYFADPYSPHQRGSNEYSNGLLREFFPKGSILANVSSEQLSDSLFLINARPRKCLGWISPIRAFLHELSRLT